MISPAIRDDWIAVKDFPLFPPGAAVTTELGQEVTTQQPQSDEKIPPPQESKITEAGPSLYTFRVNWIDDLNVIQIKCSRKTETDAPIRETSNDFAASANESNCHDRQMMRADHTAEYIAEISVVKLTSIHEQICLWCESLAGTLPRLPTVRCDTYSYVYSYCYYIY